MARHTLAVPAKKSETSTSSAAYRSAATRSAPTAMRSASSRSATTASSRPADHTGWSLRFGRLAALREPLRAGQRSLGSIAVGRGRDQFDLHRDPLGLSQHALCAGRRLDGDRSRVEAGFPGGLAELNRPEPALRLGSERDPGLDLAGLGAPDDRREPVRGQRPETSGDSGLGKLELEIAVVAGQGEIAMVRGQVVFPSPSTARTSKECGPKDNGSSGRSAPSSPTSVLD